MKKYTKSQRFAVFLSRLMMIHNVVMDVASFCGYNVATTLYKKGQIILKFASEFFFPNYLLDIPINQINEKLKSKKKEAHMQIHNIFYPIA